MDDDGAIETEAVRLRVAEKQRKNLARLGGGGAAPPGGRIATKGGPIKIGGADRTPRETLEKRLEKTPSNARCFAQGSSLMC
jgi:hypothetical protein